jgi:hypothetical protein
VTGWEEGRRSPAQSNAARAPPPGGTGTNGHNTVPGQCLSAAEC